MTNKSEELFAKIQALATECHTAACYMELGDERIEMFEVAEQLRRLTRRGYAVQAGRAMNPLLMSAGFDWEETDEDVDYD
ncbi:hypothetical protein BTJ39_22490 [Izhakiella australiensis]|uniref:Toluene hydroxylase n=1 Tax=Izhakiella australiensis TaxID=1926881 RepID=A0A1S8Y9M0_9GAMM|nr:hypothetical protein [Izhakiella australiensis]OON35556.1 hypothetical protein BTJ39_22490 [Izhakiella australiensis]